MWMKFRNFFRRLPLSRQFMLASLVILVGGMIGLGEWVGQQIEQGVQYAAEAYIDSLRSRAIQISMAAIGKAEENGYAERVIRTIKEEEVDLSEYVDFADAAQHIGHFIEDLYMTKRIHSSLGYLTPAEFELAYRLAQTQDALTST